MHRRHPKEDDHKTGPSPIVLAERRQRRAERRVRKSPDENRQALLTRQEERLIKRELSSLLTQSRTTEREQQIGSLERELEANRESLRSSRASVSADYKRRLEWRESA